MTEQLPESRVQVTVLKVPVPLLLKVIVPVGVIVVPDEVSETVAVQVDGAFTASGETQLIVIEVVRLATERAKPPELVAWSESPP